MIDFAGRRNAALATLWPTTDSIGADSSARNARLQHLRGAAAVLVLLFHAGENIWFLRGNSIYAAVTPGFLGTYGVSIFFVLSGFLMANISRTADPFRFLVDRVLRIYPLTFIVIAMAALVFLATGFRRAPDLLALTLAPVGERGYFLGGVEWTLVLELTYYATISVAIMLGLRKWLFPIATAALLGLVTATLWDLAPAQTMTPTMSRAYGQAAGAAFLMGLILPTLLSSRFLLSPLALLIGSLLVACLFPAVPIEAWRWVGGGSALLLVAAAVRAPVPAPGRLNRIGLALGDCSYALYLVHMPVIMITSNFVPASVPDSAVWLGWTAISVAVALCLGQVDIKLHDRLKRSASGWSPIAIKAAALTYLAVFVTLGATFDIRQRAIEDAAQAARATLSEITAQSWPGVLTGIDSTIRLRDNRIVLRGYGIDLERPAGDAHVAIEQDGHVIGFDRMTRMRPRIAAEARRPDLADIRFGFSIVTERPLDCSKGPLQARIVLSDGKVAPIASPIADALCGPASPASEPPS